MYSVRWLSYAQVSFADVPLPFAFGNTMLCLPHLRPPQLPAVPLRVLGQQHTKEVYAAGLQSGLD